MHHHKNRSIEILWQTFVEFTKRFHSAGRRADDDDVAFSHGKSRPSIIVRISRALKVDRLLRSKIHRAKGDAIPFRRRSLKSGGQAAPPANAPQPAAVALAEAGGHVPPTKACVNGIPQLT